jgi:hypothetical protein
MSEGRTSNRLRFSVTSPGQTDYQETMHPCAIFSTEDRTPLIYAAAVSELFSANWISSALLLT